MADAAYPLGTRAWQPDEAEGWVASEVVERNVDEDKVELVFKLANGEVRNILGLSCHQQDELTTSLSSDEENPDDDRHSSG